MLDSLLCLGLFHGSFGFFGTLGTSLGSFFALFFLQLFTTEEFDERRVSAVALAPTGSDNTQVSTFAVPEPGGDGVEKLVHCGTRHEIGDGLAARGQIAALAQRDHLLDQRTQGLGLGHSGLDSLFDDERSHQVPQQGAAVAGVTSQFPSCYFVTHRESFISKFPGSGFRFSCSRRPRKQILFGKSGNQTRETGWRLAPPE